MGIAVLIFIIVGILSFPTLIILNYLEKKRGNFYKLNKNGKVFFSELEKIRDSYGSLTFIEATELFNRLTNSSAKNLNEVYDLTGLNKFKDAKENSVDEKFYDFCTDLTFNLQRRSGFYFDRLSFKTPNEAYQEYGINLKDNELLYDKVSNVDLWEEKVVGINTSYSGFSYRFGSVGASSFGTRNIKRMPITQFILIDRGDVYTTNHRLIFIGKQKNTNKTILLENIINLNVDDICVVIGIPNGKKPMLKFEPFINTQKKRDHLVRFVSILDRIISKTQ